MERSWSFKSTARDHLKIISNCLLFKGLSYLNRHAHSISRVGYISLPTNRDLGNLNVPAFLPSRAFQFIWINAGWDFIRQDKAHNLSSVTESLWLGCVTFSLKCKALYKLSSARCYDLLLRSCLSTNTFVEFKLSVSFNFFFVIRVLFIYVNWSLEESIFLSALMLQV